MFSCAELLVILIIGLLVLGPKDLLQAVKSVGGITGKLRQYYDSFISYLSKELGEDEYVKFIVDEDGNHHKAYDLDKIKPYIRPPSEQSTDKAER